jgi:membrane-associated phospholipid phosphatase
VTTDFTYDGVMIEGFIAMTILLAGAWILRRMNLPRLGGCIEAVVLKLAISFAAAIGSVMIAATTLPLVDDKLVRWDAAIGFDWLDLMAWLSTKPWLGHLLDWSYKSLTWQTFLLLPALFIARQEARCWTFLLGWGLALSVTMMIFPFFPAMGPVVYHHVSLPGIAVRDGYVDVFLAVRDGTLHEVGVATVRGLVTMPSFHAAAAVLLAWGFAGLPYLRLPFVGLNVVMLLSSIPIGGHYLVDVIAGAIVAAAAVQLARAILRLSAFARRNSQPDPVAATA